MAQDQVWGKMHKRMDQIERRAAKTMKEDAEDEDEMWEGGMLGVAGGMQRLGIGTVGSYELAEPRIHYGRYEGTGVDWQADDDSGVNHNKKFGTEETRSVTVSEWLNGII